MKKILFSILAILCICFVNAQNNVINLGQNTQSSVTGCNFTIYDIGGLNGDYQPNRDDMITVYSDDATNHAVQVNVDILSFDVDCSDTLFIYNGATADESTLLVALTNCITDSIASTVLSYAATVTNPDGCVTIRFKTDGANNGQGFVITTTCVRPCQRVEVAFDDVLSEKVPKIDTTDGWSYIDVCPGEVLHLTAKGIYPDNGYSYQQSDATSKFTWDLGWEIVEGVGMSELVYEFPEGRGYDVSVSITDSTGCFSYIPQVFRVRTSSNPIRKVLDLPDICSGTPFEVPVGYNYVAALQVDTIFHEQLTTLKVSDTIFLPDGIQCGNPPSCSYISPVTFTSFSPAATIQSANDLLYVRISLEHSFIGDIWIKLTCPNQQYVSIMKKYDGGSSSCSSLIPYSEKGWQGTGNNTGAFFGNAYDDYGSGCSPTQMGECWNYCWSNAENQGYEYAPGSYVYKNQSVHNGIVDSTDVANMINVYHPDGNFENLIGCPMNGTWSIEVMDGYSVDNGYICGWEIALDPALLPQNWSYDCVMDSAWVVGPGSEGAIITPDTSGSLTYKVYVMDNLGCIYDTVTNMHVVTNPDPTLGDDFDICFGDIVTLDPHYNTDNTPETTTYLWNTGDETETIEVITEGTYVVRCQTEGESGLVCTGHDTIHVGIKEMPVFDVPTEKFSGCAPLNIKFENNSTPEGSTYEWYILNTTDYNAMSMAYSSTQQSPTFQITDPGVYTIKLVATTPEGCVDSMYLWDYIICNEQPIAAFEANPDISLMSESQGVVTFQNQVFIPQSDTWSYYWDFGDGKNDSVKSPVHTFETWGDYDVVLTVESASGCKSDIAHTVVIEQDLIFPNVITPNGDNINDVFAIENLNTNVNPEDPDGYRNNRLQVYDRWGKKVYDAKNYDTFARDGIINKGEKVFDGNGLPDGTYYYAFHYKGKAKTITFNGTITIVR